MKDTEAKHRVLVTGATGFLGKNVLTALLARPEVEAIAACRTPSRLPADFLGEVRIGDLLDPVYRKAVVTGVDAICHTGTWGSFWGHAAQERSHFQLPTRDLIDQAMAAGVRRFLLASSVVIAAVPASDEPVDDFAPTAYTRFWPHLDRLIDVDRYMQERARDGMQMVTMRLGHFVGRGNDRGLVPALVPRLRTRLVPWLAGGTKRMALVADSDLGDAFARAAIAPDLDAYESFNICGPEFPTAREVISYIAEQSDSPAPWYSVPHGAGYAFAWAMEKLLPVLPGKSPFLTRSIVHVAENWVCDTGYARRKLGYVPRKDWRLAVREALAELRDEGFPWPYLAQSS